MPKVWPVESISTTGKPTTTSTTPGFGQEGRRHCGLLQVGGWLFGHCHVLLPFFEACSQTRLEQLHRREIELFRQRAKRPPRPTVRVSRQDRLKGQTGFRKINAFIDPANDYLTFGFRKCEKLLSVTAGSLEIAIIPDLHCHGGSDKTIPELLAKWLDEYRPDVVVNLGDHWDLPSLAFQTKGQHSSAIGPTFQSDVAAGIQTNDVIWKPHQKAMSRWNCHRIILEGNHEQRISRATEEPERWSLKGLPDYSILQADRYYDEIVRYKGSTPGLTTVGGVTFRHYAPNGMSKPLNSMRLGYQLTDRKCSPQLSLVIPISSRTSETGNLEFTVIHTKTSSWRFRLGTKCGASAIACRNPPARWKAHYPSC
jgi:hypothetical protein